VLDYVDRNQRKRGLASASLKSGSMAASGTNAKRRGGNSPSSKIRAMNEAMLVFSVAPPEYRKILFVLKHLHQRSKTSLATHYIKNQGHLI
jgi:hypothetical protein